LVGEQDLVDDAAEALGLVGDQRDEALAADLVQREVVAQQRLRGAVNRGQRRAQLVRSGGDEVGLDLLEPAHVGQVAECVDGAAEEADARDRDPALAAGGIDGDRDLVVAGVRRRQYWHLVGRVLPARDRVDRSTADHALRLDRGDRLGGGVPEADHAVAVEQQDRVADMLELSPGVGRMRARPLWATEPTPLPGLSPGLAPSTFVGSARATTARWRSPSSIRSITHQSASSRTTRSATRGSAAW